MTRTRAVLLLASLLPSAPFVNSAAACSCVEEVFGRGILDRADAVFAGKVLGIEEDVKQHEETVTFQVQRIWKGMLGEEVRITTALSGAACGYGFKVDRAYMVYAYRDRGALNLRTGLCTHTKPLEKADADRKLFGAGYLPADIARFANKLDGSGGLYRPGHPIPFRMTYRGDIEGWRGRVTVRDGWPEETGNTFLRIERLGPPLEDKLEPEPEPEARDDEALKPGDNGEFESIVDLARSHYLEREGKYLVMWGCRLPSGFEVMHTSEIEVLYPRAEDGSVLGGQQPSPDDPVPGSRRIREKK